MHFRKPVLSTRGTTSRWIVMADNVKGFDLSFKSLQSARNYKRMLSLSHRQIEAKIIKQEFMGDYIWKTEEVS